MAEAVDKVLELDDSSEQHGVLASEHVESDVKRGGSILTLEDREHAAHTNGLETTRSQPGVDVEQDFFASGGAGYLLENATDTCRYCAYKVGDQFYTPLVLSYDNRWRDLGIFAAFIVSNLLLLFIGSRYISYNRR